MDDTFSLAQMREYIMATEYLMQPEIEKIEEEIVAESDVPVGPVSSRLVEDLKDVVFKLRAFTESSDGEMSLGIEMGMQRAADMIENVINQYVDGGEEILG